LSKGTWTLPYGANPTNFAPTDDIERIRVEAERLAAAFDDDRLRSRMLRHSGDSQARTQRGQLERSVQRDLVVSDADVVGEVGRGFQCLFDGLNPERIVIAAEAVGIGRRAIDCAVRYARERVVFDRPIEQNRAIAHPLADSHSELEAADLLWKKAAWAYDCGDKAGPLAGSRLMASGRCARRPDPPQKTRDRYRFSETSTCPGFFEQAYFTTALNSVALFDSVSLTAKSLVQHSGAPGPPLTNWTVTDVSWSKIALTSNGAGSDRFAPLPLS